MAQLTAPNQSMAWGWEFRESGWKTGMDSNLLRVDTLLHCAVLNNTTTAPPGVPADGDRYIIAAVATGVWAGKENQIAVWITAESAWRYYVPATGWTAYIVSATVLYVYTGAAWQALTPGVGLPALGTWDNPYIFGPAATPLGFLWIDSTAGFFRGKLGATPPSSMTDGDFLMWG